ncbi:hypothetical protein JCM10207_000501 [Rhodosporidiobolus poonsookiae]
MSGTNLVALPFKATQYLPNLAQALVTYVDSTQEHTHPQEVRADAQAWQALRDKLFGLGEGALPLVNLSSVADLSHYYAQLSFVLTKLPAGVPVSWPWYPLFSTPDSVPSASGAFDAASPAVAVQSLEYERLSVLYNVAAVHASLGVERKRSDAEGIKAAIASFQNASGILAHLVTLLPRLEGGDSPPVPRDLSSPVIEALRDLSLAQAQEVAWQKAVMDRLKNGTVAKLALKVAELYQQAKGAADRARSFDAQPHVFAFPDELVRFITIKSAHFFAVAQYRRSLDDLGANRYGDELGRLQLADSRLKEAATLLRRGVSDAIAQDFKSLQKTVAENLARATKDNDLIYLATPTPASSLPPIVAAALAKPTLAPELADPLSFLPNPLFASLVPKETHEVLALWEDRKKEWLENAFEREVRDLDASAASCLSSLGLPGALDAVQQPLGVPPSLLDKASSVQAEGGVDRLETMMKDVRRVASVNQRLLQESIELVQHDTNTTAEEAVAPLRQRAEQLGGLLSSAGASDALVRAKYAEWESAIRTLCGGQPALATAIPSATLSPTSSTSARQAEVARKLRDALDRLTDLRASRFRLLDAAKTSVAQNDIRTRVLREAERGAARTGGSELAVADFEELLQSEASRLTGPYDDELRRSGAQQEDLLNEIKTLNAAYLDARRIEPSVVHDREQALQLYDQAHAKYVEMLTNLQEGLRFYADLSKLLSELRDACKSYAYARDASASSAPPAPELAPPVPTAPPIPETTNTPAHQPRTPSRTRLGTTAAATPAASTPRSTRSSARTRVEPPAPPAESAPVPAARTPRAKTAGRRTQDEPAPATPSGEWDPSQGIRFG